MNRFEFGIGYTHNKIGDAKDSYLYVQRFMRSLGVAPGEDIVTDDFDINLAWTRNNLNKGYFPTAGSYQRASYKMTVPGSDTKYFKLQYDVRNYIPLTKKEDFTLLMRGRLGYGNGYGKTGDNDNLFPFYENYYAGGFSSLRGFGSNSVGPRAVSKNTSGSCANNGCITATDKSVGGNAVALASLELIFPTPFASEEVRSQVRTSAFVDAASVWDTEFVYDSSVSDKYYNDFSDPTNYRASYGVALQWMSPMGPLVFAIAKPIEIYEGDDEEFFSFTIGKTF